MENSIFNIVVFVVFGLVFVAAAVCAGIYFWNKLFHQAVDSARNRLSNAELIVSMNSSGTGKRLVVKVSPYDIIDNEPDFPDEPMGGQDMSLDILDSFFSGTMPQDQRELIESRLRLQGVVITRDSQKSDKGVPSEDSGQKTETESSVKPANGQESDIPFSVTEEKEEEKDVPNEPPQEEMKTEVSISDLVGIDTEEDVDYDHIQSGSEIPSYLMDILLNATQNDVKVVCYYCACRLGLQIKYQYDPELKEHNRNFLRSIKDTLDDKDNSQVVSFTMDYSGTQERRNTYNYPVIEDTVVTGPSLPKHFAES